MVNSKNRALWVLTVAIFILLAFLMSGCALKDSPSLNEVQVLNILYTDMTNRSYELHGPGPEFDLDKALIGWAFNSASFEGARLLVNDPQAKVTTITFAQHLMDKTKLTNGSYETEIQVVGLTNVVEYGGVGWWTVSLAHYGKWRVNERNKEVRALDDRASEIDKKMSPGPEELKALVEYMRLVIEVEKEYGQIGRAVFELVDLTGRGYMRDKALSAIKLADDITILRARFQAIPAPYLAKTYSRFELESMQALEAGVWSLAKVYAEAAQMNRQQATMDKESANRALKGYRQAVELIGEGVSKRKQVTEEMERLLNYTKKRLDSVQSKK